MNDREATQAVVQLLTAADILGMDFGADLETKDVVIPKWKVGGKTTIRLRQLSAKESMDMHELLKQPEYKDLGMMVIVAFSAVDAMNRKLFTLDDVEKLRTRSLPVLSYLQDEALALNKMGPEAAKALKKD